MVTGGEVCGEVCGEQPQWRDLRKFIWELNW